MAKFFDQFPTIPFDIGQERNNANYNVVTNIFFRLRFIREVLSNISSYYEYIIKDSDTPEVLAFNIYGDAEAHWIILMANEMVDAQYDWPLSYSEFNNHLYDKYRLAAANGNTAVANTISQASVLAWTKTNFHHYEKVVNRTESLSGITTETRFQISYNALGNEILTISSANADFTVGEKVFISTDNTVSNAYFTADVISWTGSNGRIALANSVKDPTKSIRFTVLNGNTSCTTGIITSIDYPNIPFDYYLSIPETQSFQTIDMNGGKTVFEVINREAVSYYDYELQKNEDKRTIKIIKPEYYSQIIEEFNSYTKYSRLPYIRRLS